MRKTALAARWALRSVEPGWRWQRLRAAGVELAWEAKRRETARRSGGSERRARHSVIESLVSGDARLWSPYVCGMEGSGGRVRSCGSIGFRALAASPMHAAGSGLRSLFGGAPSRGA